MGLGSLEFGESIEAGTNHTSEASVTAWNQLCGGLRWPMELGLVEFVEGDEAETNYTSDVSVTA
jgi:hypothetical protein